MCRFSLLTVALNPGAKLRSTIESALEQDFQDFEVIIKDGGSTDGSLEGIRDLLEDPRVRLVTEKDTGIYDAMNQAVALAQGRYVYFLNCGDRLYDAIALKKVDLEAQRLEKEAEDQGRDERLIIYGNVVWKEKKALVTPAPTITGFTCFRNVPCHQACFYDAGLCKGKPFEPKYKICADYEHFLWCHYQGGAKEYYLNETVAEYEGGGFSESKKNRQRLKKERKEITEKYMGKAELFKYRAIMALTLAPLRTWLSENPRFSGAYHKLIHRLYRK